MKSIYLIILSAVLTDTVCVAAEYSSPERFEKAIQRYVSGDEKKPPPKGAIVCIGSSSMGGWHKTIREDLAPLTVIPRGFGGSTMNDALYYVDRIAFPYEPRAVLLYEGDNDVARGIEPVKILETFNAFVKKIHDAYPECRVYFISIKPSISRWHIWPKMEEANGLIEEACANDPRLTFIDVAVGMLNEAGEPKREIFKPDNLHMNRDGYIIWRDIVRPVLLETEEQHE